MSNLVKYNKEEFVARYNPANMITEFRNVNSLPAAIEADNNSLAVYRREIGEDPVLAILELHLLAFNESLNVSNPLTSMQIKEIALEISTLYYCLNLAEIYYVFRKAKRGEYGKFYNSINMPEVLGWFANYSEERMTHFANKQLDKHSNFRDDSMRSEDRKAWERHERLINKDKK